MGLFRRNRTIGYKKLFGHSKEPALPMANFRIYTLYNSTERPEKRGTIVMNGKSYYINVEYSDETPLRMFLTVSDVETNKTIAVLNKDFGPILRYDKSDLPPFDSSFTVVPRYVLYLDTKLHPKLIKALDGAGFFTPYNPSGREIFANNLPDDISSELTINGYTYPIVKLSLWHLAKYDYDGMVAYETAYNKELELLNTMTTDDVLRHYGIR